jgi:hypothetical protein
LAKDRLDGGADVGDGHAGLEPIELLRPHALQRIEPPHQGLQLPDLRRGWRPCRRLLRRREPRDQLSIKAIRFAARQPRARVGVHDRGIDDADHVPGVMQPQRERITIGAGRFETGMNPPYALPVQPGREVREPRRRIRARLVTHCAIGGQQRNGDLRFGDIDPETGLHTSLLSVASCAVSLAHTSCARMSRFRYRSTGRHTLSTVR